MTGYLAELASEQTSEEVFVTVLEAIRSMNETMTREELDFALAGLIQMFSIQPEGRTHGKPAESH